MKFYITDVFGENKYSGNQLATLVADPALTDREMQQIAHEIHFSETTFILAEHPSDGVYPVRIFTPEHEVDFAGHPTLGTAFLIQRHIIQKSAESVTLRFKAGDVPVFFSGDGIVWMEQIEPVFGSTHDGGYLAAILNLPPQAIDARFPVQEVSTGLPHIIVPLVNLDYLKKARVSTDVYFAFIGKTWAKNILIFCPEPYSGSHTLSVRMFADYLGIPEDPATGSGNGCLAGYLVRHNYLGSAEIDISVGQGYEVRRPSLLRLRAKKHDRGIAVSVGGRVIAIAEGTWG